MQENILKYVLLSIIPGFGVISQNRLLQLCGDINNCFEYSFEELLHQDRMRKSETKVGKKRLEIFTDQRSMEQELDRAKEIIGECDKMGITIIPANDKRYPIRFTGLRDMPCVLYIKGDLKINEYTSSVGIVGARRCSFEGKIAAIDNTINNLQNGAAIISGMAKGIDSYAHTAALKNDGYTIAILGNGPDICYPKEHGKLYEEIISKGCILSEYPPGTKPNRFTFPKRNRLIAALSDKLYVVDIGSNSGTATTIEACEWYGREVKRVEVMV